VLGSTVQRITKLAVQLTMQTARDQHRAAMNHVRKASGTNHHHVYIYIYIYVYPCIMQVYSIIPSLIIYYDIVIIIIIDVRPCPSKTSVGLTHCQINCFSDAYTKLHSENCSHQATALTTLEVLQLKLSSLNFVHHCNHVQVSLKISKFKYLWSIPSTVCLLFPSCCWV